MARASWRSQKLDDRPVGPLLGRQRPAPPARVLGEGGVGAVPAEEAPQQVAQRAHAGLAAPEMGTGPLLVGIHVETGLEPLELRLAAEEAAAHEAGDVEAEAPDEGVAHGLEARQAEQRIGSEQGDAEIAVGHDLGGARADPGEGGHHEDQEPDQEPGDEAEQGAQAIGVPPVDPGQDEGANWATAAKEMRPMLASP